ncbi:MAG TPA: ATP-binding protein [Bacteroidales bacterium]|nr:ATP-binding protein [Bacteroidales bacterium]
MEKRFKKTGSDLIRIAITGPESTGKSLLSQELAAHYHTAYVPEYAREYISHLDREYNYEDLEIIAKGQIAGQIKAEKNANGLLFCDTELTVIKIWAEHRYNKCPLWISENLEKYPYDLYLLCNVDLPWENDPQREHPHLRSYFFNWYLKELQGRNVFFAIVEGNGMSRFNNALQAVDGVLHKHQLKA